MRRKFHFLLFLLIGLPVFVAGQQTALKTNALFWATTTPNIGVEVGISHNITIELWGAYNAWKYPDDMKLNLYLLQPEARYWFCRKFEGHFIGMHGHYGHLDPLHLRAKRIYITWRSLWRRRKLWLSLGTRRTLGD